MGRNRKHNKHLPKRMQLRSGTYYFIQPHTEKWISLGRDLGAAYTEYGKLAVGEWHGTTMGDVLNRYQREVSPGKAAKTYREELPRIARLQAVFGAMRPDAITAQHVYRYLDSRKHPTSAKHDISVLSHAFTKAIRWGAASRNPVQGIERPRTAPRRRYVTDAEFLTVHALASPRMQIALELAVLTGLRRGDLLALTRNNLLADGILVTTSKTGKALLIEYTPELSDVLERSRRIRPQVPGLYIVRTQGGKAYSGAGFSANWQRLMAKAERSGVAHFTFRDLRAKSGSDSASVKEAQERLGHASEAITRRVYMRRPLRVKPLR